MPHSRLSVPALAAACAFALAPGVAHAKPLEKGDHGTRVKQLQRALGLTPDGVFGPGTHRKVRSFQRRHSLHADGIVGAATWRMIRRARSARAVQVSGTTTTSSGVKVQRRGSSVRLLQRKLGIGADGVFGPGTSKAVRAFQRAHGLTADGIVGPGTWSALGVRGTRPVLKRAKLGGSGSSTASRPGVIFKAISAGNRIARKPYRYGGGHASFSDSGYDCSGSVSYVLHAMGRLDSPLDSSALMSYGSPGRGRHVTIYANPSHAYMVIDGKRFDTTARSETGSRWTAAMRSSASYVARHPPGL